MDSSIDSDHSWESHSTGSSGRGTQHSDQGSLGSAQRAALLASSHDETDGTIFLQRQIFSFKILSHNLNVSLSLQVAWTCRSLRFPVIECRSVTRTGSKFKSHRPRLVPTGIKRLIVADRLLSPLLNRRPLHHLRLLEASSRCWKVHRVAPPWLNRCLLNPTSR